MEVVEPYQNCLELPKIETSRDLDKQLIELYHYDISQLSKDTLSVVLKNVIL